MKKSIAFLLLLLISTSFFSQNKNPRFNLEINYGLNGNFFVRSYEELDDYKAKTFYKKDFLGSISGLELSYKLNSNSSLFLGYSRSVNKGEKEYFGSFNGVYVAINHFNLKHYNNFYQVGYERAFKKENPFFKYQVGLVYVQMEQQEISLFNQDNTIYIDERDFKNYNLEEAGVFAGLSFSKKIDTKFEAGLKLRVYYLASTNTFEAITFTPTLKYNFWNKLFIRQKKSEFTKLGFFCNNLLISK